MKRRYEPSALHPSRHRLAPDDGRPPWIEAPMAPARPMVPDRLASGRLIDLAAPADDFDFTVEIAGPLGRVARFAGQTPEAPYSVAEHSVRGADAILAELLGSPALEGGDQGAGDERGRLGAAQASHAAFAFLLHDAHEVLGGDVKRPFVDLCELIAARDGIAPGGQLRAVIDAAKAHLDAALAAGAGLPWPLPAHVRLVVGDMDERMAAAEMRHFWPAAPLPPDYEKRKPVAIADWARPGAVPPWSWQRAAAEWITRFDRWRRRHGGQDG